MLSAYVVWRRWAVTTCSLLALVVSVFALLEARRILGSDRPCGGAEVTNELMRLAQILGISFAVLGPVAALDVGLRLRSSGSIWVLAQSAHGLSALLGTAVACGAATCAAVWLGSRLGPAASQSLQFTKVGDEWVWRPWLDADAVALPRGSFRMPAVDLRQPGDAGERQTASIGNAHWVAGAGVVASLCRGVLSGHRSSWQAHAVFVNAVAAAVLLWAWMPRLALVVVVALALAEAVSIRIRGVRAT